MSIQASLFEIYGEPRELWDIHAGFYRNVDDLSRGWQPSPELLNTPLPLRSPLRAAFFELPGTTRSSRQTDTLTSSQTLTIDIPTRKIGIWRRLWRLFVSGNFKAVETVQYEIPLSHNPHAGSKSMVERDKVKLHEWKAYGYWARPRIREVDCPNSPVINETEVSTEALEAIAVSLRDEMGEKRPENWIPGLKHPALPPRPPRWKTPQPGEPLPFPWEVQINPLLQHHRWGPSAISWWICLDPRLKSFHGRATSLVPINETDLAQPATYPFLTHMHFNAVADDCAPQFPWPFTVVNERGIKVVDVLCEIWKTFNQPILEDEFSSWSEMRRTMSRWAMEKRCEFWSGDGVFVRRCDSFGAIMFFRGIEPTVDGGGWMITFGTC